MAENNPAEIPRTTLPRYAREAAELALQLATLSTEELERMLRTNRQIAATNRRRYRQSVSYTHLTLPTTERV